MWKCNVTRLKGQRAKHCFYVVVSDCDAYIYHYNSHDSHRKALFLILDVMMQSQGEQWQENLILAYLISNSHSFIW